MATFLEAQGINECPVCMEEYVKPKKLECDHSLCEKCLNRLDFGGSVKCPICKRITARKNVKPDFRLGQWMDFLKQQELCRKTKTGCNLKGNDRKYSCEMCESSNLAFWCGDCEVWLCETCTKNHPKSKVLTDHRLESFQNKLMKEKAALSLIINKKRGDIEILQRLCSNVAQSEIRLEKTKRIALDECDRIESQMFQQIHLKVEEFREKIRNLRIGTDHTDYDDKLRKISRKIWKLEKIQFSKNLHDRSERTHF